MTVHGIGIRNNLHILKSKFLLLIDIFSCLYTPDVLPGNTVILPVELILIFGNNTRTECGGSHQ